MHGPRVQRIDDAPPEDVACGRRRGNEEAARRPARSFWLVHGRLAEEELKARARGAELSRRSHGQVELQCIREQKHAVDGRPRLEIGELNRVQLLGERVRPVVENVHDRRVVGDRESQVQVGELVAAAVSERTDGCSGNHALVFLRELEHSRTQPVALFDGEHRLPHEAPDALAGEPDRQHERDDRQRRLLVARNSFTNPLEADSCAFGQRVEVDRQSPLN